MQKFDKLRWFTYILYFKNKIIENFQIWLSKINNKCSQLIKVFYINRNNEFILIKLKNHSYKRDIIITYIVAYIQKEEW